MSAERRIPLQITVNAFTLTGRDTVPLHVSSIHYDRQNIDESIFLVKSTMVADTFEPVSSSSSTSASVPRDPNISPRRASPTNTEQQAQISSMYNFGSSRDFQSLPKSALKLYLPHGSLKLENHRPQCMELLATLVR